jgi:serine/threonine-protein kinase HipA
MPHLEVYLNRTWAGQLLQDEGGRLGFSYREAFLHSPEAVPLSRHLPLRPLVFGDEATRAFFANLLPEGGVLEQTARQPNQLLPVVPCIARTGNFGNKKSDLC